MREKTEAAALRMLCLFCSEAVLKTASICPHCRSELPPPSVAEPEAASPTTEKRPAPLGAPTPRPPGSTRTREGGRSASLSSQIVADVRDADGL